MREAAPSQTNTAHAKSTLLGRSTSASVSRDGSQVASSHPETLGRHSRRMPAIDDGEARNTGITEAAAQISKTEVAAMAIEISSRPSAP